MIKFLTIKDLLKIIFTSHCSIKECKFFLRDYKKKSWLVITMKTDFVFYSASSYYHNVNAFNKVLDYHAKKLKFIQEWFYQEEKFTAHVIFFNKNAKNDTSFNSLVVINLLNVMKISRKILIFGSNYLENFKKSILVFIQKHYSLQKSVGGENF